MLKDFSEERFDVIIQAGQSNSLGYGFGDVDTPYEPNGQVWYMNCDAAVSDDAKPAVSYDYTISRAVETVTGNEIQSTFALAFAREYLNKGLLKEGRRLLILRCAAGATGFLDHHWGMAEDMYLRMIEMTKTALALNKENRLAALLWHQGEMEIALNASYEVHYRHLKGLVDSVRTEFGAETLPFVAGDFVQQWKSHNAEACVPVVKAMRDICEADPYGAFVETDGLLSNMQEQPGNPLRCTDMIHFSRKASYLLGERYFAAYMDIVHGCGGEPEKNFAKGGGI